MISVIIPTLNADASLAGTLHSLLDANCQGLIREVIVTDGGSTDRTIEIAEEAGANLVHGPKGRGGQLMRGAAKARGEWLLFVHADTELSSDWVGAAMGHMEAAFDRQAAVFQLQFDSRGFRPWLVALGANIRARIGRLPYGDQGLLISKAHYTRLGGFADKPIFEDVDLIRRIVQDGGRGALQILPSKAITSAERYVADGYFSRVWRNSRCVRMYFKGAPIEEVMEVYLGTEKPASTAPRHDGKAASDGARQD